MSVTVYEFSLANHGKKGGELSERIFYNTHGSEMFKELARLCLKIH